MAFSYLEALDPITSELNSSIVFQKDVTAVTLADIYQRRMELLFEHRFDCRLQDPLKNLYQQKPHTAGDILSLAEDVELEGQIVMKKNVRAQKEDRRYPDFQRPALLDRCDETEKANLIQYDCDDIHLLMYHCLYGGMNQYHDRLKSRANARSLLCGQGSLSSRNRRLSKPLDKRDNNQE